MPKKILIIDDDRDVHEILELRLAMFGYEMFHAMNGNEGCLKATEIKPDLIFLDISMPGIDGVETLKKLKTEMPDDVKKIPVVMLTTHEHLQSNCLKMGAAAYMTKPFDLYALKEVLARLLP